MTPEVQEEVEKYEGLALTETADDPHSIAHTMEVISRTLSRVGTLLVEAEHSWLKAQARERANQPDTSEARIQEAVKLAVISEYIDFKRIKSLSHALSIRFKSLQSQLSFAKEERKRG